MVIINISRSVGMSFLKSNDDSCQLLVKVVFIHQINAHLIYISLNALYIFEFCQN